MLSSFCILMCHCVCYVRSADDDDVFPDELKVPLGRANHMLLDDVAIVPNVDVNDGPKTQEESSPQQEATDRSSALVSILAGILSERQHVSFIVAGLFREWKHRSNACSNCHVRGSAWFLERLSQSSHTLDDVRQKSLPGPTTISCIIPSVVRHPPKIAWTARRG